MAYLVSFCLLPQAIMVHKTRVSEMRLLSRTSHAFDAKGSLVPVAATVERRNAGGHHADAYSP